MQKEVYKRHINNYSDHWWFQARKKILETVIKRNISKKRKKQFFYNVIFSILSAILELVSVVSVLPLISLLNKLVAGVGFEPTTFRL